LSVNPPSGGLTFYSKYLGTSALNDVEEVPGS